MENHSSMKLSEDHVKISNSCEYTKYIVITGGSISGIGKGIITSSIGLLLKSMRYRVTVIKIDPYLNVDAGNMSPFEHGEVFVLDDSSEVDLDLGNYERFLDIDLTHDNSITTGKIYRSVIEKERQGHYLGKTVQLIPHVTDEIKNCIHKVSTEYQFCLIELGGTIGDIESMPFIEAIRQLQFEESMCLIHVTLVPSLPFNSMTQEQKTKPTQHSVRELRSLGLIPDMIITRSKEQLKDTARLKISSLCSVKYENVISVPDLSNIYHVPLHLLSTNLIANIGLKKRTYPDLAFWEQYAKQMDISDHCIKIAIVGKYIGLTDSYHSLIHALNHAACHLKVKVIPKFIDADKNNLDTEFIDDLKECQGILIPGGFGNRGIDGKIVAAKYARENNVPFLGICLGFQIAIIELARLTYPDANSTEFNPSTTHPVIHMPTSEMKLGLHRLRLHKTSKLAKWYHNDQREYEIISERYRHRYKFNIKYTNYMNWQFTGYDSSTNDPVILELPYHPFFIGVQYHPEYKSRPTRPSAPFLAFLSACIGPQISGELIEDPK